MHAHNTYMSARPLRVDDVSPDERVEIDVHSRTL